MKTHTRWLSALLLFLGTGNVYAQSKDAVELLPAQTLACLELRQPARLSREVAALVKGSALENLPRQLARMHALANNNMDFRYYRQQELLSVPGMFLSPEAMDEAGRIHGGFVALTGFGKDGLPQVVAAVQSGTSNFPGFFMRAYVLNSRAQLIGEVEGVPLYREKMYIYKAVPVPAGGQPQREERFTGPVLAQLSGYLLFGSSEDSLKDVIRRAKGKSTEPSLASIRAFKESAALRDRPGLFGYVDMTALEGKLDEIVRQQENGPLNWVTALRTVIGKEAVRKLIFSLTLHNGSLEGRLRFDLNDKSEGPLLALLPDRPTPRDLLHFAPENALWSFACGLGEGEKRWSNFLNLLDTISRLDERGDGNRPSRVIREMEQQQKLRIDKDLLAELSGAGIVLHKEAGHKPVQWTLLLRASTAEAAAKLDKEILPRVFSLGSEEVREPVESEMKGQRIKTVRAKGGPPRFPFPLHYGHQGSVLVIGQDQARVVESLVCGSKKAGLLAMEKVAASSKDIDAKATGVGVVASSQVALELLTVMSTPSRAAMAVKMPAGVGKAVPVAPAAPPAMDDKILQSLKSIAALHKASEPLVFDVQRQSDSLTLELRPLPLRRMTPRLVDVWIELVLKSVEEAGNPPAGNAAPGAGKPPLPPPPPRPDRN